MSHKTNGKTPKCLGTVNSVTKSHPIPVSKATSGDYSCLNYTTRNSKYEIKINYLVKQPPFSKHSGINMTKNGHMASWRVLKLPTCRSSKANSSCIFVVMKTKCHLMLTRFSKRDINTKVGVLI